MSEISSVSSSKKASHLSKTTISFLSGAISATLSKTCGAPLERLKLLYQTHPPEYLNRSFFSLVIDIFKQQGILSFWRGNLSNVIRYFPLQSFMLTFKDEFKHIPFIKSVKQNNSVLLSNILASGLAGVCALTIIYPLDFTRTNMAYDITKKNNQLMYNSIYDCMRKNVKMNGLLSIYSGWITGSLCYFIYRGIQLGCYDTAKTAYGLDIKNYGSLKNESILNFAAKFGISFVFTCTSATIVYPLDTIRRRCMIYQKLPIIEHIRIIKQSYGIKGFYKGLFVNYGRNLTGSLVIVGYDYIKPILNNLLLSV